MTTKSKGKPRRGGPLTAAAFDDTQAEPLEFLTAREGGWRE